MATFRNRGRVKAQATWEERLTIFFYCNYPFLEQSRKIYRSAFTIGKVVIPLKSILFDEINAVMRNTSKIPH